MFQINDKVVCVDDSVHPDWSHLSPLVKGNIYCVAGMTVHPFYGTVGVIIAGHACILGEGMPFEGTDVGYRPVRFRKVSRKTEDVADESIITERIG